MIRKIVIIGFICMMMAMFVRLATLKPPAAGDLRTQLSPGQMRTENGDREAENAPELALNTKGLPAKLSDLHGKVVLLDFWATWCGPCRDSIPEIVRIYSKYKDSGLVVVGISKDQEDTQPNIPIVQKSLGINYPIAIGTKIPELDDKYPFSGIPAFVLIDKRGKMRMMFSGYSPKLDLDGKIKQLLDES